MKIGGASENEYAFVIEFTPSGDQEDAKDKLQQLIFKATGFLSSVNREADKMLSYAIEFKYRIRNEKVYLFAIIDQKSQHLNKVAQFYQYITDVVALGKTQVAPESQDVNFEVKLENTAEEISQMEDRLIFEPFTEAFEIKVTGKIFRLYHAAFFALFA